MMPMSRGNTIDCFTIRQSTRLHLAMLLENLEGTVNGCQPHSLLLLFNLGANLEQRILGEWKKGLPTRAADEGLVSLACSTPYCTWNENSFLANHKTIKHDYHSHFMITAVLKRPSILRFSPKSFWVNDQRNAATSGNCRRVIVALTVTIVDRYLSQRNKAADYYCLRAKSKDYWWSLNHLDSSEQSLDYRDSLQSLGRIATLNHLEQGP